MKLALLCLCIAQLAFGSRRISDPRAAARGDVTVSRARASPSTGSLNEIRVRPLFARRGYYERQRILEPKPRGAPAAQNEICLPAKVSPNPVKIKCSQLAQSCLPQSGCCDPCAACHCRFFNTICFCRKTKSQYEKKT
ncbi:agouti-signaling protein-like [Archocentrus centrarchus]|uniref:agouti-signaling protein-like n=1 Tax=Archocentrus centrarchus TaxID=63155 RepID=UPI0011EA2626|nr:agouti-signaling protein-like [Archocentrus centrarchus]